SATGPSLFSLHDALPIGIFDGPEPTPPTDPEIVVPTGQPEEAIPLDPDTTAVLSSIYGTVVVRDHAQLAAREPRRGEVLVVGMRSEEHTSELQSRENVVC